MACYMVTFTFTSRTASNTAAACTQSDATSDRLKHDAEVVGPFWEFPIASLRQRHD